MLQLLVLRSPQPDQLAQFYAIFLPAYEYHRHGKGPMHYSFILDNLVFEIYPLSKHQDTIDTFTRLGFGVDHLDLIAEEIIQAGHILISPPAHSSWGYQAIVKDPDGRKIELTENVVHP